MIQSKHKRTLKFEYSLVVSRVKPEGNDHGIGKWENISSKNFNISKCTLLHLHSLAAIYIYTKISTLSHKQCSEGPTRNHDDRTKKFKKFKRMDPRK